MVIHLDKGKTFGRKWAWVLFSVMLLWLTATLALSSGPIPVGTVEELIAAI